jgi:hypothetical protein
MVASSERWADVVDDDVDAGVHLGVVHPIGRVVERPCARPDCSAPGAASLTFAYSRREAWIGALDDDPRAQSYDLCARHVARARPPLGWQLRDERPEDDRRADAVPTTPTDLGGDRTVAVLAAALRAVPDAVSEDAVRDVAAEVGAVAAPDEDGPRGPDVTHPSRPAPAAPPTLRPATKTVRPLTKPVLVIRDRLARGDGVAAVPANARR